METWYGAGAGVDLFSGGVEGGRQKYFGCTTVVGMLVGWVGGCCGVVLKVGDFGAGN